MLTTTLPRLPGLWFGLWLGLGFGLGLGLVLCYGHGKFRVRVRIRVRVVNMFGPLGLWLELTLPKTSTLTFDPNPQSEIVEVHP